MWLINTTSLKPHQFFGSKIPKYAILSHTWEDEELSFQELALPSRSVKAKKGYNKIRETCLKALHIGLHYAWVDTCCIDKTSSAEITESINSMFQWYKNAVVCFVYLSDLPLGISSQSAGLLKSLKTCRWFTRGWTLQELIAPNNIRFYNQK
ncbi:HET-domain-containing protein [Stipitochalara longipes BDJ]|nr:HET-domain-containing protein [Stipitochalara longipes BDJ]